MSEMTITGIPFSQELSSPTSSPFTGMGFTDVSTGTRDVSTGSSQLEVTGSGNNLAAKLLALNIYGPLILIVVIIGVVGNSLSVAVMSSRSFRGSTLSRPIRCLALSDSLYLLCIINSQPWFVQVTGVDLRALSEASCKLLNWTTRSTAIFSAWMVILLAAERFFAVWFFEMARRVFSMKTMTTCIVSLVIITTTFNAIWTAHSDAVLGGRCIANAKGDELTKQFLAACVFLYVGMPAPMLFVLNFLIILRLRLDSRNKARSKAGGTAGNQTGKQVGKEGGSKSSKVPEHRATAMLLAVTTVFTLLVPPIALCHMVAQYLGENLFTTNLLPLFLVGQTAQLLFVLNCAVNFYLYVVMGSTFRTKLVSMLCRCRGLGAAASSKNSTSSSNISSIKIVSSSSGSKKTASD